MDYIMNKEGGEYNQYIVQELTYDPLKNSPPEFKEMYQKFSRRILWIDGQQVPGAFQMNTAWYHSVPERDPVFEEHVHNSDEIIGFFGSNPDDPYDLGAVIEVTINGENHRLPKSSVIFAPACMPHMRIRILEVTRPMFHFSVVTGGNYDGNSYK